VYIKEEQNNNKVFRVSDAMTTTIIIINEIVRFARQY